MYKMHQTMRWFGPQDSTSLADIRQAGAQGIVTALHHIGVGDIWTVEEIRKTQAMIEQAGLIWSVVESLPVHEDIKRRSGNCQRYIENYKKSIQNLAVCGIKVITYNFMPVLDWVRTDHQCPNSDGTIALRYHRQSFIYFDVFLLKRPGAENDYSDQEISQAKNYGESLSEKQRNQLSRNVLLGLPGSKDNFTVTQLLALLEQYNDIDANTLRSHLITFLKEVVPIAISNDVQLAIHPDDPPFTVMGLPRIVSTTEDLHQLFSQVPAPNNGLCYCTGSLGVLPENDLLNIIDNFGNRIHFLHLRNIRREAAQTFRESAHLQGSNPIAEIMEKLLLLMQQRKCNLPMRPDHGFLHSKEKDSLHYPGYSLMGRLKGLSELRGLEQGILYTINKSST